MSDEIELEYPLILSFVDQSQSFVNGWEAGELFYRLQVRDLEGLEGKSVYAGNREMVERILAHFEYSYSLEPFEDGKDWFVLRDVWPLQPKPSHPKLTVVR